MSRIAAIALPSLLVMGCRGEPDHPSPPPPPTAVQAPEVPPAVDDPYARPPGGSVSPLVALNRNGAKAPDGSSPGTLQKVHDLPRPRRTAWGWEVQYPSKSPVPTPAVVGARVISSGGFNSHEVYAVDATSGRGLWGVVLSDDGPSSMSCAGERCVLNTESCTTFALDVRDGALGWGWWLGDPQTSAPTVAGGRAFASYPAAMLTGDDEALDPIAPDGATHALAAFDLATGRRQWSVWLDGDVMSAPVAVGAFLYVTTFGGTVMKIDQATGDVRYAVDMRATSAPVVVVDDKGGEALYVTVRADERGTAREAMVRADLGASRVTFRTASKPAPYLDGEIQRGTEYAEAGAIDDGENGFGSTPLTANAGAASGTVGVAAVSTMQRFQGSRILIAGDLAIATLGDEIVAVDRATGERRWQRGLGGDVRKVGGHLGTAPILAGGDVVVATTTGDVQRLVAKSGAVRVTYRTGAPLRTQPVAMNGWIYAGSEDGRLIAIDTGDRTVTGWSTWGGDAGHTGVRSL